MKGDYPDYRVEAEEGRQNRLDPNFTAQPQPPLPVAFQVIEKQDSWSGLLVQSLSRFDHEIQPKS